MRGPSSWTIHQIAAIGVAAGIAALILWPVYAGWPDQAALPFIAALAVACASGALMLWMTVRDLGRRPGRGSRLRPIRTFDVVLGIALVLPSLAELRAILPASLETLGLL